MARQTHRLSSAGVKNRKTPGLLADGGGLYLQVTLGKDGQPNKSWLFRFAIGGRERHMGLGSLNTVGMGEAREEAERCRKLVRERKDPIALRDAARAEERTANTRLRSFDAAAAIYLRDHEAGWKNAKHRQQWVNTLRDYVSPAIGKMPVQSITAGHVVDILRPIWVTKPETARRVRGRIEVVLDYAADPDDLNYLNPARMTKRLRMKLPKLPEAARPKHHPALPYPEVGDFIAALHSQEGVAASALRFAILTAARTGEVIGATWDEVDFEAKAWVVPAGRMKGKREHRVPLSAPAVALLRKMHETRQSRYVFPGDRPERPLSNMAMEMVLRRMRRSDITVHGFRSTFRDWAAERTSFPREVAEAALAHVLKDKTEAAYQRGDLFEKRRRLMAQWAAHCDLSTCVGGPMVVPLRRSSG